MDVTTSAPGKLFLFGEYGVLAGGWSVVAAVDRRVTARRHEASGEYEALGADLDDATALPRAVLAELDRAELDRAELDRAAYSLDQLSTDIRQLFEQPSRNQSPKNQPAAKLGLGSSAASTVALTAACLLESDVPISAPMRRRIFACAFAAHRRLQGGRGSCADVAASVFGGIVGYRLHQPCEPFSGCNSPDFSSDEFGGTVHTLQPAQVRSCPPLPVRVEPIWLGEPAVSTSFVSRCEDALRRDTQAVQATLCRTSELAQEAIDALQRSDASRLLELVAQADDTLETLGELIKAPIVTDQHRALRRAASRYGVAVKPSGAGGGDFSVAFGPADASWQSFLSQLPEGVHHIPMALGASGVRLDPSR